MKILKIVSENEMGYRITAKNKGFWSQLIVLQSVASVRRKWLRTTHTKERRTRTNSLSLSDRSKISSDWYQNQKHYQPILPSIYREHFIKYYEECPFNSDFLLRSVFSWWPSLLLRVYRCGSLLPTQSTTCSHSGRGWWPVYPTSRWSYIIYLLVF